MSLFPSVVLPYFCAMRIAIVFALVALWSCGSAPAEDTVEAPTADATFAGVFANGVFIHERLKFTLPVAEGWRILPQEELSGRQTATLELLRRKVSDLDGRAEAFAPFLALEPYASPDSSYVTLLFMAEDLERLPQVNNAYDYFNQQAAQVSGQSPEVFPRYEFSDISQQAIGGRQAFSRGTMIHSSATEMNPMLSYAVPCGADMLIVQVANFDSAEELNLARGLLDQLVWTTK